MATATAPAQTPSTDPPSQTRGWIRRGAARAANASGLRQSHNLAPIAILAGLVVYFAARSDRFLTVDNAQILADQSAIPLVAAVGMTLVVLLGSIDLSTEGVMGATSIAVSLLVANNINERALGWTGVVIAIGLGAAFGLANGLIHTRGRMPSVMVTIGTWFIGLGLAASWFPDRQPSVTDAAFRSLALERWGGVSRLAFVALAVAILGWVVLRYTNLGRGIYAIGGDEHLARLVGVPVARYRILAFTICGLCAGVAGVLASSRLGVGSVQAGQGVLFTTISSVVIGGTSLQGGRGGIANTVIGVAILTVLSNGMVLTGVDPSIQQAVEGSIIVAAVVIAGLRSRERLRIVK